jgi:site-specific recombinase
MLFVCKGSEQTRNFAVFILMARLFHKKSDSRLPPEKGKAVVLSLDQGYRGLDLLVDLIRKIRPDHYRNIEQAETKMKALLFQLHEDRSALFSVRRALLSQFLKSNLVPALTQSGIVSSRSFIQELMGKLKHKILPELLQKNDFLYVISHVFYRKSDFVWVQGIDKELWMKFFEMIGIQVNIQEPSLIMQLKQSMQLLSYRVAMLGLEKELMHSYDDVSNAIYPFIEQNRLANLYLEKKDILSSEERKLIFSNIQEALYNCEQSLKYIHDQRIMRGTSLAQTFVVVRLRQQIQRLFIIIDVLDRDQSFDTDRFINYFFTVIRNTNTRNSVGEFLSQNLGLVAYQIAEHKGRKGEKYISSTRKDFLQLFWSAAGGGFIISVVAITKNLLGKLPLPLFWQGAVYGANYAAGFVLMDSTNTTLATKQPAYTASAVASSLDTQKHASRPDLWNLAITVGKVARSQIASFAGNLLIVFPFTFALAWLYDLSFGVKIASGEAALKLLADQHPYHSLSLLYACFTGFFLFVSGLIAGYVENHIVYGRIGERLRDHPVFTHTLSPKALNKLARFVQNSAGGFAGSVMLGIFLGVSGPLGKFLGVHFDIRHITIAAGNASIGLYGVGYENLAPSYLAVVFIGVLLIGMINFLVSFSLAFFVAVKSRGIKLKEYPEFIWILFRYFRRFPMDFIFPPGRPRVAKDLY